MSPGEHFFTNTARYHSEIFAIEPSADNSALAIRGRFTHWTTAAKMPWLKHPPEFDWYECEDRIVVCRGGEQPSCTWPLPYAYKTFCRVEGKGDLPGRPLKRPEPMADFQFLPRVVASQLQLDASGRRRAERPLPGWAVTALGAEETADERRPLLPSRVRLKFR